MQRLIHKRWLVLGFMSTLTNKSKKYSIIPIPDKKRWQTYEDLPVLSPPTMKKGVGRPCRNQRREEGEDHKGKRSKTVKCKKRECYRHNARTCKGGGLIEKQKKEMQTSGKPLLIQNPRVRDQSYAAKAAKASKDTATQASQTNTTHCTPS